MARIFCSLCGWNSEEHPEIGRTGHLKHTHDITPYDGVVEDYFLHPWQATALTFNNILQHPILPNGPKPTAESRPRRRSGNKKANDKMEKQK